MADAPASHAPSVQPTNTVSVSADDYATFKQNESALASLQAKYDADVKAAGARYEKLSKEHKETTAKLDASNKSNRTLTINSHLNTALADFNDVGKDYIGMKLKDSLTINDKGAVVTTDGKSLEDVVKEAKANTTYAQFLNTKRGTGAVATESQSQSSDNDNPTNAKSIKAADFDKLPVKDKTQFFIDNPTARIM